MQIDSEYWIKLIFCGFIKTVLMTDFGRFWTVKLRRIRKWTIQKFVNEKKLF